MSEPGDGSQLQYGHEVHLAIADIPDGAVNGYQRCYIFIGNPECRKDQRRLFPPIEGMALDIVPGF